VCAESTPAEKMEADPSSDWEAQLVADEQQDLVSLLVEDRHRPQGAQWLQELMKEK